MVEKFNFDRTKNFKKAKYKVNILSVDKAFDYIELSLPFIGVIRNRCSENMQQNYRRTPMSMCDFKNVAKQHRHECSPVNLLHIFRTSFCKSTSEGLLLKVPDTIILRGTNNCINETS